MTICVHVDVRGQCLLPYSIPLQLDLETEPLTEPGAHHLRQTGWPTVNWLCLTSPAVVGLQMLPITSGFDNGSGEPSLGPRAYSVSTLPTETYFQFCFEAFLKPDFFFLFCLDLSCTVYLVFWKTVWTFWPLIPSCGFQILLNGRHPGLFMRIGSY